MRALEPTEIAVFGADAVIGPDNVPISQSSLRLSRDPNHEAALDRAKAKATASAAPSVAATKELLDLVKDTSTDAAMKERVEKIAREAANLRLAATDAEKASKELDVKRLLHLKLAADEKTAFEVWKAAEVAAIDMARTTGLAEVTEEKAAQAKIRAEIEAASAKLAAGLADVDARLALVRQAAR